ncbi:hypothetical protein [Sorangium sp. So ce513]|uniref:hypothetical protein n=1 Tax=Sorangium sp. So ce513 TaxID=3133315 RepID=UPI003F61420C
MCDRGGGECGPGAVCEPDEGQTGGCGELTAPAPHDDEGAAVAREGEHAPVTFDADSDEDVRGWPRRMCISVHGRTRRHGLWYPDARGAARFHEITSRDLARYERVTGRRRRGPASTWGTMTPVSVTVSEIVVDSGVSTLRWRSDGPTYSFEVYNLDAQPEWRVPLECTLMRLPISHLRATGLKSLCFDIRQPSTEGRFVTDGGATWLLSPERHARRADGTATEEDNADGKPAIFVAFAALNRAWWRRDGGPVTSERAMDQVYRGRGADAVCFDTIYHEHGHHYQAHRAEPPEREQRRVLNDGELWLSYLHAIPYNGNTRNQGEGFAEAYRRVFTGEGIRGGGYRGDGALAARVEAAFATLGMPTPDSVARAWLSILENKGLA